MLKYLSNHGRTMGYVDKNNESVVEHKDENESEIDKL